MSNAGRSEVRKVSGAYGAPMGRMDSQIDYGARLYLRRVRLDSGGYDEGGAYWGLGQKLWAYGDGEDWRYMRAFDRDAAKAKIREEADIPPDQVRFWQ